MNAAETKHTPGPTVLPVGYALRRGPNGTSYVECVSDGTAYSLAAWQQIASGAGLWADLHTLIFGRAAIAKAEDR